MQTQHFMHYISQETDPKGKVNMHCSRHAMIGPFGHCPEAKTHFTVSNPKHGLKIFLFWQGSEVKFDCTHNGLKYFSEIEESLQ